MILKLEMILLVMSYEKNTLSLLGRILNLLKIIFIVMFFVIQFCLTTASFQFFKIIGFS